MDQFKKGELVGRITSQSTIETIQKQWLGAKGDEMYE